MQLGWIDFNESDKAKAVSILELLEEKGAVDEIGIGVVRDAFANYFFPGTSTIQTRARYFLLTAYILKDVLNKKFATPDELRAKIRDIELECGKKLLKYYKDAKIDYTGIIGSTVIKPNSNDFVKRTPTDIYWTGMLKYHIIPEVGSLRDFVNIAFGQKIAEAEAKKNRKGSASSKQEDEELDDVDTGLISNKLIVQVPNIINQPGSYLAHALEEEQSLKLTKKEAIFLKYSIIQNCSGSLYAYILENNIRVEGMNDFSVLYDAVKEGVSKELKYMMKMACEADNLISLARLRYNMLYLGHQNTAVLQEWERKEKMLDELLSVNLDDLFSSLKLYKSATKDFLAKFQQAMKDRNYDLADKIVKRREIEIKTSARAKLTKPNPNGNWIGGYHLDYRFSTAKTMIKDIYEGEEADV